MNNRRFIFRISAIFTLFLTADAYPEEPAASPITVAVLPFESSGEKLQGKAAEAAVLLAAQLSTNPDLWMVERTEMEKILSEHTINLSGLADPAQSAQVGRILGAKALITGRLIQSGDASVLVAKIMSTESSRVFGETASMASDSLEKPAAELAEKIGKLVAKQARVFQAPVERREDRIARLRKMVEGKPLPSVQVHITERDLRREVVDPAVETEFGKVLIDLGFDVVDANQGGKLADVAVTGEAFSETGARRGQLISARGRAEVKAIRRSDGKVLAVDRETSVAVDIAEGTAGKTALQQSALSLIERMLPKIVAP